MLWFDEKLYLAVVLKSILSFLFHWQNGATYRNLVLVLTYIRSSDAMPRDRSRFDSFLWFSQFNDWFFFGWFDFFFNTQIPFICRNEQFAQFKKSVFNIDIWLSNKIFPISMCPLVQPTCSHYFSNFYPLFDPKPNYIIQNTMIYHRFPLKIFFCPFFIKKKKEFRYSKNAKHVKVNFVDDVLAIDLKKIEGRW